jgi:hypothetical protein
VIRPGPAVPAGGAEPSKRTPGRRPLSLIAILSGLPLICGAAPAAAQPVTHSYAVSDSRFGAIGVYDRTSDEADGVVRATWRLKVTVRVLGLVVHRETGEQSEVWRAGRLESFRSVIVTNGRSLSVSGEADGARFLVRSPDGVAVAPASVVASDPWQLTQPGAGVVVSIRTGKIDAARVTGGETETLQINGASIPVRHFHVNTSEPDKWQVWMDRRGVPVKFRSREKGDDIDFTLISTSPPASRADLG